MNVKDFRSLVCQLNVLSAVAKVFNMKNVDLNASVNKSTQLNESLLNHVDETNMVYYGGTVRNQDIAALKKLLFRVTRGHAIITSFELQVHEDDIIRNDFFQRERIGYIVLLEDQPQLRTRVERVCQSFVLNEEWKVFNVQPRDV